MLHDAPSTSIKRLASTRHYPIGPDCLLSPFSVRYSHYTRGGTEGTEKGRQIERTRMMRLVDK